MATILTLALRVHGPATLAECKMPMVVENPMTMKRSNTTFGPDTKAVRYSEIQCCCGSGKRPAATFTGSWCLSASHDLALKGTLPQHDDQLKRRWKAILRLKPINIDCSQTYRCTMAWNLPDVHAQILGPASLGYRRAARWHAGHDTGDLVLAILARLHYLHTSRINLASLISCS